MAAACIQAQHVDTAVTIGSAKLGIVLNKVRPLHATPTPSDRCLDRACGARATAMPVLIRTYNVMYTDTNIPETGCGHPDDRQDHAQRRR
jgi:hypothetical protein